jgi:hypothetical protein
MCVTLLLRGRVGKEGGIHILIYLCPLMQNHLLIYTDFVTERLVYTWQFICNIRGVAFEFCNDPNRFIQADKTAKLVYSDYPFEQVFPTIIPARLLFDDGVENQALHLGKFQNQSCLQFEEITDPVAAIFYVISRYEEYLSFPADEHDRFSAEHSILKKFNLIHQPVADIWAEHVLLKVQNTYSEFSIAHPGSRLTLSFDIDNTFAFKHKNWMQLLGGRLKDFAKGNSNNQDLRREVLAGQTPDPNDTFDLISRYISEQNAVKIFWHLGDFKKFDRNISWTNAVHQRLIQKMGNQTTVGIHPSYASYLNEALVRQERGRLEHILKKPVLHSRQHFLKVRFPATFELLNDIGIKNDYSVGFADDFGFRMGTAHTLPFYNLRTDEVTELMLHPFVYMDGTFNQYLKLSPDQAIEKVDLLMKEVKQHGGNFICIWHNDTINNRGIWKNWKQVLDATIDSYKRL